MPSFGRIGRQSNKSQQSLLEQQQQNQHHHHHQASLQLQQQAALQQQLFQQQSSATVGSAGGALPHPQSSQSPLPSQRTPGLRKLSSAGLGLDSSSNPSSASPAPLPSLSPACSFHHQHPQQQHQLPLSSLPLTTQQQQQQFQLQLQEQHLQQVENIVPGQPLGTPQLQPQSQVPQHQHQHQLHPHIGLDAQTRDALRKLNPSLSPPPNTIPLNQSNLASNPNPNPGPNPGSVYPSIQQQPPQLQSRDNIAELIPRPQSGRHSQHISPLQNKSALGTASSSADDLLQGVTVASPPTYRSPPSLTHSQTAPSELKRSARKLIKHLLPGSSSRPADNSAQESQDSALGRKPSNRASLLGRANIFAVDHPDWGHSSKQSSRTRPRQQTLPPLAQPPSAQSPPVQGTAAGPFDSSYPIGRPDPSLIGHISQEALPSTVRHVPPEVIENPLYDQENLTFYQRQAIAHHQAQLQQQQAPNPQTQQPQLAENPQQPQQPHSQQPQHSQLLQPPPPQSQQSQQADQQDSYAQITVDPAQNSYPWPQLSEPHQSSNHSSVYVTHLTAETQAPNPETVSQLSHESRTTDSEPLQDPSLSTLDSSSINQAPTDFQLLSAQQQQPPQSSASQNMPPPASQAGAPGQGRPSADNDRLRAAEPSGPPAAYRHSQGPLNTLSSLPTTPATGNATPSFRPGGAGERQQFDATTAEDRNRTNSPQPSEGVDHETKLKEIVTKYKHVKRLYFEGKTQIEQMTSQIEQLQNAVANQRMSQSRTALDDNEYSTRFKRLNGAITNLAFNIRKDWSTLPGWIEQYVTGDAIKTGKQEMTAVGRAVISRWVMEEIFNRCFHPELDIDLSSHLKKIEQNIRKHSYTMTSQEEFDALTNKVVTWRMATLEGLQSVLNSPDSVENRSIFTKMATTNLTSTLLRYLTDPPPAGVDGSATIIVELAVGLAANLPLESRDVALTCPMPGDLVQLDIMEVDKTPLPPLPEPVEEPEENVKDTETASKRERTRSALLSMTGSVSHLTNSRHGSTASITVDAASAAAAATTAPKEPRVRFAGFIGVEVRGRQVLSKAPVWTVP